MALALFSVDSAFVAPTPSGFEGNLRASGTPATLPIPSSASITSNGIFAIGCAGASILAVGAAASRRIARRAAKEKAPKEDLFYGKEMEAGLIPRPEDLLESPKFPAYMGSTSGYFSKATRERHAITWTSPKEQIFEMPTTGWALMNQGENLCYFRKKEQCIALGKQLRKMKIDNYKIYRIKKDGTVIFMHPADGVFPEKVNKGRVQVNGRPFSAGGNPQPGLLKWTKYHQRPYEADALTTMFVKARMEAFYDQENLFPLPLPEQWVEPEDKEEFEKKAKEALAAIPNPPPKSL